MSNICEYCNKEFKSISNLNYHKKTVKYCLDIQNKNNIVTEEKKYECNICNKKFNRNHHLEIHFFKCKEKNESLNNKEENNKLKKLVDELNEECNERKLLIRKEIMKNERKQFEINYKDKLIKTYINELEDLKRSLNPGE